MKMLRASLLIFVVALLALTGCGPTRPMGISVSLVNFRPTEAALLESRGVLTLRYTNESISPLGYSGSSHKLYLNDSYVGKAVSDQPFGVPPLNSVTQDVTIMLENLPLIQQLVAVRDTQTASYRLESTVFQTVYEEKYEIKLRSQGSVDLRNLVEAAR